MIKISLCICFYNAEEFIERSMNSFVKYLTNEIEVVFVDDGSDDNSLEIVKNYPISMNNIKIISHEFNKGLPIARKTAIDNSNGTHIMFLDADDEFISNPFILFLEIKNLNEIDIIEYGAITDKNEVHLNQKYQYNEIVNGLDYLNDYFRFSNPYVMLCLRLFRKNLFYPISFLEEEKRYDDTPSIPLILSRAKKIIVLSDILLRINLAPNSITRKKHSENEMVNIKRILEIKANLFYKIIPHITNNLEDEYKNKNFKRFIIQMALYHSFYSATSSIQTMLKKQKQLMTIVDLSTLFKYDKVFRVKSPINLFLIILGFKMTSIFVFYFSKINIFFKQRIRRIL